MKVSRGRFGRRSLALGIAAGLAVCTAPAFASFQDPPSPSGHDNQLGRLVALGLPVYCAGSKGREFALTFDDGPGPYTPLALRILRRGNARATFFLVGKVVVRWPRELPRELRMGALGDHTWTHRFLPSLSAAQVDLELARTKALVQEITHRPVHFFRPPYGALTTTVEAVAQRLGLVDVVWSVDSRDSAGAKWNQIGANVLHNIRPGSIVLMHENRGQTLRALRYVILPHLGKLGLRPVSLPKLLRDDPPSLRLLRGGLRACVRQHRYAGS
jgi:peptidoglycan/xylan/chitin deacetylase (PgdA/CDA1 family)